MDQEPSLVNGINGKQLHLDYLWLPVRAQGPGEDADDLGGSTDNSVHRVLAREGAAESVARCRDGEQAVGVTRSDRGADGLGDEALAVAVTARRRPR